MTFEPELPPQPAVAAGPRVPRGAWVVVALVAAVCAPSIWWGVQFEAREQARIAAEGEPTMQGPLLLILFAVLLPLAALILAALLLSGVFARAASVRHPSDGFAGRFGAAAGPLVLTLGVMVVGTLVLAGAGLTVTALTTDYLDLGWSGLATAFRAGLPAWGLGCISGLLGLLLTTWLHRPR